MRTIRSRMTPLRQRMWEDLQLRNYSPLTIHCYLRCVAAFAKHFGTSPAHLGPEQVRTYQLFLVQEKHVAWPSVVQTVCALRFFYRVTLGRPVMLEYIAPPRRPFTLPIILSQAEVATFLTPRTTSNIGPSSPRSLRRGCGCLNCACCRSRISTAPAWSSGCGKAKASTSGTSCCPRNSCRCSGTIGSRRNRAPGSFPAIPGHTP